MKVIRGIIKIVIILLVVGGLGWGGYQYYLSKQASTAATNDISYTRVPVTTGSLTQSVTGTGSLTISKMADVKVDFPVTISESLVREGESVKAGDPIAKMNEDALKTAILTMDTELSDLDTSIAQLASAYTGASSITSAVNGRVKQIFAKVGNMTADVMNQYGTLAVLSCDGRMRVTVPRGELELNQSVLVRADQRKYTGIVTQVTEETADILFSDSMVLPDETVEVLVNNESVGEGRAKINMPLSVSTTLDGYVDAVPVRLNASVSKGSPLFKVTHIPASTEYDMLVSQRAAKLDALADARQVLIAGAITAGVDGIVATAPAVTLEDAPAGTSLSTVYVGDAMQMVISVDELDIIRVAVGQKVRIAMDAVTDKTYDATVSYISQIGTPSSGVTSYAVTLDVESDGQLKIGMNGTATIVVREIEDAILVPLTAVSSGRRGSYVWKYTGETGGDSTNPGEQVYIETGLSNEEYAEVLSGLSEGDEVLVTRSAAGTSGGRNFMPSGVDFGGIDFGNMPSGGERPNGSFTQRTNTTRNNGGSRGQ